jgi:hypothetical protein
MKRLLLIVLLLFPAITLALWVYFGVSLRHRQSDSVPASLPMQTNSPAPPANQ